MRDPYMAPLLLPLPSSPLLPPPPPPAPRNQMLIAFPSSSPAFLLLPFRPRCCHTNSFRFSLLHPWRASLTSEDGSTASASTSKSQTPLPHPLSSSSGSRKRFQRLFAEALIGCVLVGITVAPLLQAETSVAAAESEEAKNLGSSVAAAFVELTAKEPPNALSVPTWTIHVASVVEWVTAMVLVWQYGEIEGNENWKGLSWGMVPLLGGAMCACTWHFYYNAVSLEALVVMQSALTLIGNFTLWIAAFRIYKSVQKKT